MKPKLTLSDFERAATQLGCEVAAIRAVAEVESDGGGFISGFLLVVRFEGHEFQKKTAGRFDHSHPTLSHRYMPKCPYNQGTAGDWLRLEEARQLAGDVAFACASYGTFQIMGYHAKTLGYQSPYAMVQAFNESEGRQLDGFVKFIIAKGLVNYLRRRDWASFAYLYNGANFRDNDYDVKMKRAYERYRAAH